MDFGGGGMQEGGRAESKIGPTGNTRETPRTKNI